MLRFIFRTVLPIFLLIAVPTAAYYWTYRNYYAGLYVGSLIPAPTTVESTEFHTDTLFFHKALIKTSDHSSTDIACAAPHVELRYEPGELFKSPHHIRRLQIDSPLLNIEIQSPNGAEHSWVPVLRKFSTDTSSTKFRVDTLSLSNVRLNVTYQKTGETLAIPPIKSIIVKDIGKEEGVTLAEILYAAVYFSLEELTAQHELMNITNMLLEPKLN